MTPKLHSNLSPNYQSACNLTTDNNQRSDFHSSEYINKVSENSIRPAFIDIKNRGVIACSIQDTYHIDSPPASPASPSPAPGDDANDDADCYLLNTEDFDNGCYLTPFAARKLKEDNPGLFDEMDDNPAESNGGGWDVIMNEPFTRDCYQQYQAIAKLVYQYQNNEVPDAIFDAQGAPWIASKTSYGAYRTQCCFYEEDDFFGNRLIIDDEHYQQIKKNLRLEREIKALKRKLKKTIGEKRHYQQLATKSSEFASSINKLLSDNKIMEKLNAIYYHHGPDAVSLDQLLTHHSLIIGTEYQQAEKSFEQQRNASKEKKQSDISFTTRDQNTEEQIAPVGKNTEEQIAPVGKNNHAPKRPISPIPYKQRRQ